jgi:hypothetical protein
VSGFLVYEDLRHHGLFQLKMENGYSEILLPKSTKLQLTSDLVIFPNPGSETLYFQLKNPAKYLKHIRQVAVSKK